MLETDEDALVCDLAETYGIYDYRQLPAWRVAVFAYGLREDSRIKLVMSGQRVAFDTMLWAGIFDRLSQLVWAKTKDAAKGRNQPKSILDSLTQQVKEREEMVFASGEEFEIYRQKLLEEMGGED
ncbi:Phage protein [Streptococcus sp. DD10]|uniref:DUF5361 domain-containing protein n=1 Tax=Streptococcus sp. DD10 TaxID=1777878 RepID=UPI00079727A1|nr:DUF5361 domain-containing protein [Streptococcus sp. DD10]KXT73199.1 Phage protein [Streptococcus sp. DD10]